MWEIVNHIPSAPLRSASPRRRRCPLPLVPRGRQSAVRRLGKKAVRSFLVLRSAPLKPPRRRRRVLAVAPLPAAPCSSGESGYGSWLRFSPPPPAHFLCSLSLALRRRRCPLRFGGTASPTPLRLAVRRPPPSARCLLAAYVPLRRRGRASPPLPAAEMEPSRFFVRPVGRARAKIVFLAVFMAAFRRLYDTPYFD